MIWRRADGIVLGAPTPVFLLTLKPGDVWSDSAPQILGRTSIPRKPRGDASKPVDQRTAVALSQLQRLIIGEESSMQSRTGVLAFTLGTATCFGMAAMAADLPKEGTSTGTFSYVVGTFKATPVGKERLLTSWDGNGLSFTNGFGNHMSWHCWGAGDYTSGLGLDQFHCVGTDTSGDQIIDIGTDDKHALDAKARKKCQGALEIAGISGGGKYVCYPADFKSPTEGIFLGYCTLDWNYKFP